MTTDNNENLSNIIDKELEPSNKIVKPEENLKEGNLIFSISGYKDFTGNIGEPLTIAKHGTYDKVIYDRTPVTINGIDKETYIYGKDTVVPTTKDTDVKEVTLTKNDEVVENYELGKEIIASGKYVLTVKDKANHITTKEFTIEKQQIEFELSIEPKIELDGKENIIEDNKEVFNDELTMIEELSYKISLLKGVLYDKNNTFKLSDGRTIQTAIVENNNLRKLKSIYESIIIYRNSKKRVSEINFPYFECKVVNYDLKDIRSKIDEIDSKLQQTDFEISKLNCLEFEISL